MEIKKILYNTALDYCNEIWLKSQIARGLIEIEGYLTDNQPLLNFLHLEAMLKVDSPRSPRDFSKLISPKFFTSTLEKTLVENKISRAYLTDFDKPLIGHMITLAGTSLIRSQRDHVIRESLRDRGETVTFNIERDKKLARICKSLDINNYYTIPGDFFNRFEELFRGSKCSIVDADLMGRLNQEYLDNATRIIDSDSIASKAFLRFTWTQRTYGDKTPKDKYKELIDKINENFYRVTPVEKPMRAKGMPMRYYWASMIKKSKGEYNEQFD